VWYTYWCELLKVAPQLTRFSLGRTSLPSDACQQVESISNSKPNSRETT
jgi:hypothetical protein